MPVTHSAAPAAAKSLQSCPTLCNPIDSTHQAPLSWDSPGKNTGVGCHYLLQCTKVKSEREVAQLCLTLWTSWTAAHQAPLSMEFSRQEYWSGLPLPSLLHTLGCPSSQCEKSYCFQMRHAGEATVGFSVNGPREISSAFSAITARVKLSLTLGTWPSASQIPVNDLCQYQSPSIQNDEL